MEAPPQAEYVPSVLLGPSRKVILLVVSKQRREMTAAAGVRKNPFGDCVLA